MVVRVERAAVVAVRRVGAIGMGVMHVQPRAGVEKVGGQSASASRYHARSPTSANSS